MDNGGGILLNGGGGTRGRTIHLVNGQANTMTESCDQRYQVSQGMGSNSALSGVTTTVQ